MNTTIIQDAINEVEAIPTSVAHDWSGSRFQNLINGRLGKFGEAVVSALLEKDGCNVRRGEDTAFDLRVDGRRVEIKTLRGEPYRPGNSIHDVYPHNWDDLYVVAVMPHRLRLYCLSSQNAEQLLGKRHMLSLSYAFTDAAELLLDEAV